MSTSTYIPQDIVSSDETRPSSLHLVIQPPADCIRPAWGTSAGAVTVVWAGRRTGSSTPLTRIPCLAIETHILAIFCLHTIVLLAGLELGRIIPPAPAWPARNLVPPALNDVPSNIRNRCQGGNTGSTREWYQGIIHIDVFLLGPARCLAQDLLVIRTKITNFSVSCPKTQAHFPSAHHLNNEKHTSKQNRLSSEVLVSIASPSFGIPIYNLRFSKPFPFLYKFRLKDISLGDLENKLLRSGGGASLHIKPHLSPGLWVLSVMIIAGKRGKGVPLDLGQDGVFRPAAHGRKTALGDTRSKLGRYRGFQVKGDAQCIGLYYPSITLSQAHEGTNPIERVVNGKNCLLSHHPHLNAKAEMDFTTHLFICMNLDYNKVDQTQRKWYTEHCYQGFEWNCELAQLGSSKLFWVSWRCRFRLVMWKAEKEEMNNSPYAPHLHTNYAPSAAEILDIKNHLTEPLTLLSTLDAEIEQLNSTLCILRDRHCILSEEIESHRALISPFRQLPLVMLGEIFSHCLPTHHNAVLSLREAPLLLGRVCSTWRSITLSTPQLWASLHMPTPRSDSLFGPAYIRETATCAEACVGRSSLTSNWM
ncbi:uncharacterized protein LACBIDRAFT_321444 [Laccaria bicolor S238N-H82]|uniref:Predicted protein n=1 Tax=Laccaria bicolor (strain S238N-H82 / ATCC MYA-4686) TaxID=486041 RepID=B0CQD9_LACBS|nr:uncharacterized protein LACBIDRAFT_321444 [Laccaria bicolor S238N-H82]EDR15536.1 predicted protein [Laccaria bicolor S238N-H82]|eukprot:XP_001873744.1 predicted protein [Laccaria bicolor S238N-H82]